MNEARLVCEFIEGKVDAAVISSHFAPHAVSPGFDPSIHLRKIGVANQTTMLARESLEAARAEEFRTFDTICSATQERQDAVMELLSEPLDAMIVIGGFNSSNTISLAALCAERVPTYHVESAAAIDPERKSIHYRRAGIKHVEGETTDWLPSSGAVRVGLTAGASTPNNKIGEAIVRILATRGLDPD